MCFLEASFRLQIRSLRQFIRNDPLFHGNLFVRLKGNFDYKFAIKHSVSVSSNWWVSRWSVHEIRDPGSKVEQSDPQKYNSNTLGLFEGEFRN